MFIQRTIVTQTTARYYTVFLGEEASVVIHNVMYLQVCSSTVIKMWDGGPES